MPQRALPVPDHLALVAVPEDADLDSVAGERGEGLSCGLRGFDRMGVGEGRERGPCDQPPLASDHRDELPGLAQPPHFVPGFDVQEAHRVLQGPEATRHKVRRDVLGAFTLEAFTFVHEGTLARLHP